MAGLKPPVNLYVIAGDNGLIFDAGYGKAGDVKTVLRDMGAIKKACDARNIPLAVHRILPSHMHPDHFSGLKKIRHNLGVSVLLTEKMARLIASRKGYVASYDNEGLFTHSIPGGPLGAKILGLIKKSGDVLYHYLYGVEFLDDPDVIIPEKGSIDINGRQWLIFPSPGHAGDHISLYDPEKGILFGGDNVLRSITTWLGPPKSDLDDYIHSLIEMLSLPRLELILPAHGSPVTEPKKRIEEIISWRMERLDLVRRIVMKYADRGVSLKTVVAEIYPRFNPLRRLMARGWVELSIRYFMLAGQVVSRSAGGRTLYYSRFRS